MTPAVTPSLVLTVWPPYFDEIRSGRKSVEGRPFTSRYMNLQMGHFIHIVDKEACNSFVVEITRLTKYSTFEQMLETEGLQNCLPGTESVEQGVEAYYSFPNYADYEKQHGVIALGIKVHQTASPVALSQPISVKEPMSVPLSAELGGKAIEAVKKIALEQFGTERSPKKVKKGNS